MYSDAMVSRCTTMCRAEAEGGMAGIGWRANDEGIWICLRAACEKVEGVGRVSSGEAEE